MASAPAAGISRRLKGKGFRLVAPRPTPQTLGPAARGKSKHRRKVTIEAEQGSFLVQFKEDAGADHRGQPYASVKVLHKPKTAHQARQVQKTVRLLRQAIATVQARSLVADVVEPPAPATTALPGPARQMLDDLRQRLGTTAKRPPSAALISPTPEQVRQGWIDAGLLRGSTGLAAAWSRSRQALDQMVQRGELLAVRHKNRLWYPAAYAALPAAEVADLCRAIGVGQPGSDPVAQCMFLLQPQAADDNHTVLELWGSQRERARQLVQAFLRQHPGPAAG